MQPSLALLTLRAVSVLVAPGPDEGCPSARQVSAALLEHAPAAQKTRGLDSDASLTLVLPPPGTPQEPSVSLIDEQGTLRLFRILARPGTAHARDCAALADTVAIIVQRYLEEVELPESEVVRKPLPPVAPTAPPPSSQPSLQPSPLRSPPPAVAAARIPMAPRWDLALGSSRRLANQTSGLEAYELRLSLARTLGSRADTGFLVRLWSGSSGWRRHDWSGGYGEMMRIPAGLEVMWRHAASVVEMQLGLAALLDCWILGARYQTNVQWDYRFAVAGAVTGGAQVPLGKRFFARLSLDLAVAPVRYSYVDRRADAVAFSTPRVFGDVGFSLGMSLR